MGRRVFFKTVPYMSHICARRGYTDMGRRVGNGTGRRVKRYNDSVNRCNGSINHLQRFMKRYNDLLNRYNDL
jgi:hypothetical protein